ncbi:hypothetical protein GCM10022297_07380 [Lactobacillus hamsteri]|uniref:Uncharacterized protein n=1 Tax=Lactobacillus hamsteri DSM 5661 = JCM 6256 TaxID=1423754 RepID=A0A0R1Y7Q9_9LACO|nr:hypothetical protein [Lactobacillus hamsteri]KRM38472.1 hypothetical protein FC39_GL001241 [Lactobacillus hamsteri DSM 5661 = JCM 6256]
MTKFLILGASLAAVGIVRLALKEIQEVSIENEFETDAETARFKAQTIDMNLPSGY